MRRRRVTQVGTIFLWIAKSQLNFEEKSLPTLGISVASGMCARRLTVSPTPKGLRRTELPLAEV